MIKTLPLDEIEKHAENIYEAIVVMAKRARQINDEQKELLRKEYESEFEEFDSEDGEEERKPRDDYPRLPKPTTLALEEFLAGKLQYEYKQDIEEEEATES